uniref:Uncharacterized protein n=2 Tax=Coccolithus braarudii TaxID=221442 RepID=A0A7S0L1U0_9EUKA
MPALAQQLAHSDVDDDDDDDAEEGGGANRGNTSNESEEEEGGERLPSIDEALNAAIVPDFLQVAAVGPSYGNVLDEPQEEAAPAVSLGTVASTGPATGPTNGGGDGAAARPDRGAETTRQKNSRKEKLGQATFTLKWDRDCGAEKASGGLETSATLKSRTLSSDGAGQRQRQPARGSADAKSVKVRAGANADAPATLKDRTKIKRQRDQSASFLGGRWKTEQEMHMRDFFDS